MVKCDTFPLLYRELDFTCWHHSPRHHLYDYCFSWCRSGNLLRGQNFLYWSQFSRLLFYCRVGFSTPPTAICRAPVCDAFASPCAMSRPHARHQNYTSPCANQDGAHTIAPQHPLTHQPGTTDRVIRDTDVGATCGLRDASPVVTTAMAAALPWPRMIPPRRTPMTTEDRNHYFQILLKS